MDPFFCETEKNYDGMSFIKEFSNKALLFLEFHLCLVYYNHIPSTARLYCACPEWGYIQKTVEDDKTHINGKEEQGKYQNNVV